MHSIVFKGGGAHNTSPTEEIIQTKGQPSTSEHLFPPPQSLQSSRQQLNSFIHSSRLVGTNPGAGPMLSPQYIVSVLSSWGLPPVDSPVSEQQLPGTADVESLFYPSATLPLRFSQSGCSAKGPQCPPPCPHCASAAR